MPWHPSLVGVLVFAATTFIRGARASLYNLTFDCGSADIIYSPVITSGDLEKAGDAWTFVAIEGITKPPALEQFWSVYWITVPNGAGNQSGAAERYAEHTFVGNRIEYWGFWGSVLGYDSARGAADLTDINGTVLDQKSGVSSSSLTTPILLGAYTFPEVALHTTRLVPTDGRVYLSHFITTVDIPGTPAQVKASPPQAYALVDLFQFGDDKKITGSNPLPAIRADVSPGDWNYCTDVGVGLGKGDIPHLCTDGGNAGLTAWISIFLAGGHSWVELFGTIQRLQGLFRVQVDPAPPGYPQGSPFSQQYSAHVAGGSWSRLSTYFYAVLDPAVNYTITISNVEQPVTTDSPAQLGVGSVILWALGNATDTASNNTGLDSDNQGTGPGTPSQDGSSGANSGGGNGTSDGAGSGTTDAAPNQTNVGAIAGGVVGGVLGLALLATLVWFLARRRRDTARRGSIVEPPSPILGTPVDYMDFEVDETRPTPFVSESQHGRLLSVLEQSKALQAAYDNGTAPSGSRSGERSGSGVSEDTAATSKRRRLPASSAGRNSLQAADAGSLHVGEEDMIPPAYNPNWEVTKAARARSGSFAPPLLPSDTDRDRVGHDALELPPGAHQPHPV